MANAQIGSKEWFTEVANRTLYMGLDVVKTKLTGMDPKKAGNTSNTRSTTSSAWMGRLPYILGAAALVLVGVLLYKRG